MASHKALGRGLNALFSDGKQSLDNPTKEIPNPIKGTVVRDLSVDQIKPNRHQPRTDFDQEALEELASSIRSHGVQQPLVVSETAPNQFELVAGERRLRASKIAGLSTVPCLVKSFSNRERFEVALIENLQREDLNSYDEAIALEGLMRQYQLTQEQVAETLGKSRSAVANVLRLLKLHEDVQSALRERKISEGHAKVLAGFPDHAEQLSYLEKIIQQKLSVRDLENLASHQGKKRKTKALKAAPPQMPEVQKFVNEFQQILGRRVEIQTQGKKGWVKFAFYSPWDFELLCKKLGLLDSVTGSPKAK